MLVSFLSLTHSLLWYSDQFVDHEKNNTRSRVNWRNKKFHFENSYFNYTRGDTYFGRDQPLIHYKQTTLLQPRDKNCEYWVQNSGFDEEIQDCWALQLVNLSGNYIFDYLSFLILQSCRWHCRSKFFLHNTHWFHWILNFGETSLKIERDWERIWMFCVRFAQPTRLLMIVGSRIKLLFKSIESMKMS